MSEVGSGTHGVVKLVSDDVVEKRIGKGRFRIYLREVNILRYIKSLEICESPIVEILGYNLEEMSYTMERCNQDIVNWLKTNHSRESRWRIAGAIISAIYILHSIGLVHADIKPANVMLKNGVVKLIDFGLAGPQGWNIAELTSPAYSDTIKSYGFKDDIYSLGVTLTEVVSGIGYDTNRNLTASMGYLDGPTRNFIMTMLGPLEDRPDISGVCKFFKVKPVLKMEREVVKCEIDDFFYSRIVEWVKHVMNILAIRGPHDYKTISLRISSHLPINFKHIQIYALAYLAIYGSLYRGSFDLSTLISLCPKRMSWVERRERLLKAIHYYIDLSYIVHEMFKV